MTHIFHNRRWQSVSLSLSILCFSPLVLAHPLHSSDVVSAGRYLTLKLQPSAEQIDPLSAIIRVNFFTAVRTVGDAINEVLRYSGYSLVESEKQSPELRNTLKKSLPFVHCDLGPLPLRQALITLMGTPYDLQVDPLNRTLNFTLKPSFQPLTEKFDE